MTEAIQEEPKVSGPGAQLKARREALNLSLEEIADNLHLRPSVVENLENDFFDHTVSMTFTKGYVRLYAKHLELEPEPLLELFEQLTNPIKQPAKLRSFSQKVAKQASDARLMMVTWFIILLMVGLAVVWWWQLPDDSTAVPLVNNSASGGVNEVVTPVMATLPGDTSTNVRVSNESETASTTDLPGVSSEGETIAVSAMENSGQDEQTAMEVGISDNQTAEFPELAESSDTTTDMRSEESFAGEMAIDGVEVEHQGLPATTVEQGLPEAFNDARAIQPPESLTSTDTIVSPLTSELVFTFSADCWMNLTDATGEVIAYGVKAAGRVMPVSGIPPFEVVLGAPQGVQLTVDGEVFDMSGFPAGRTARFTVGEALNE